MIKKITVYILFLNFFLIGACWARESDCLSPAMSLNTRELQQSTWEMILKQYVAESLLSTFDYYKLNLDMFFGTKIRAKVIEDELRSELSKQDIMIFAQSKDTLERQKVKGKVINEFKGIIRGKGLLFSTAMAEYLEKIMEALYQELKLKINGQFEYIIADLKNYLRNPDVLTPEDIMVYNQASNSQEKHNTREKVRAIAKRFLAKQGIFFDKHAEDQADILMLELKREFKQKVEDLLNAKRQSLMKALFDSLSVRERFIYFSQDMRLNIEQERLRRTTKNIFQNWLKENGIYFEGANWAYFYRFTLSKIMKDVVRKNQNVYLRPADKTAVFKMAEQINAGIYEDISQTAEVEGQIEAIRTRITDTLKPFKAINPIKLAVPECDENTPVFVTNAVIIDKDDYCFGFFSHDPLLIYSLKQKLGERRFNELFPVPTLILSREMFEDVEPVILKEYIYLVMKNRQGIGSVFGAQKFFPENYEGFIEGKDYELNIIKTSNPGRLVAGRTHFKFQPGYPRWATKPFFGRTGMKLWEILRQKTKRVSGVEAVGLPIKEQIEAIGSPTKSSFNYKPVFLIEKAI